MHMGNARGGVLGDALASVLDRAGYDVWREFYVNDAGNQIEKFASSIDARYRQLILGEDAVEFPEDGYHGEDIKELAAAFRAEYGDGYLDKDVAERHAAMARFGLDRNIPKMQSDLKRYGVEYDEWFFESSLHESGYVAESVQKLTDRGYTYEKDGALWLKTAQILFGGHYIQSHIALDAMLVSIGNSCLHLFFIEIIGKGAKTVTLA
jgi:arginyl-tRNA synthetase